MGLISTATLDVFQASATINASDVIGAFDTIYNVLNGGLDSNNTAGPFD